ncbi:MAG: GMC oxidoreductase [Actinomycetota bacterium]|nr:GMC oxidoreductase [Actinomycetota bacterium]
MASAPSTLGDEYDVLIVGSGYGGSITAARLGFANAQAGGELKIAVLERGEEHPTGTFPETQQEFTRIIRTARNPLGWWDIPRFKTIDVLQGNGLGGTSLNNMNVAIVPDREVFLESWPAAIRDEVGATEDGVGALDDYYGRAKAMLGAVPYRDGEDLPKTRVFDEIAAEAGTEATALCIVVSKEDRTTRFGVERTRCTNCANCGSGCNVGAKNTLMTNYLPMAAHYGVELHPRVEVEYVTKANGGWMVACAQLGGPKGTIRTPRQIKARRVILSANSLGSSGILLRSAAEGLRLSRRLGKNFSGNGDNFGIAYNTDRVTEAQGFGTRTDERSELRPGPSITSVMRFGDEQRDLRKRYTVEDLTCFGPLVDVLRTSLAGLATTSYRDWRRDKLKRWRKDVRWGTDGALNHSLGFLLMCHDNSDGELMLDSKGAVRVNWPGATTEQVYEDIDDLLRPAVEAIGGTYMKNPRWGTRFLGNHLVTAHPIGGCCTADSADYGVVDHAGRVFDADGGFHDGLYVSDGSVLPRALAVNPLLTISMFAERAAEHLRGELGLPPYDPVAERDDR